MELITREQFALLLLNGSACDTSSKQDAKPVIKLQNQTDSETWLIASVDPNDPDTAYCLYTSNSGTSELKNISIEELTNYQHPVSGKKIERDVNWRPEKSLKEYYSEIQNN